jgi:predicted DNA-binding protein
MQRNNKYSEVILMSKTITLRLSDENYKVYRKLADRDNRPISNFIETAVKRFIEHNVYLDEFEMEEIRSNKELNKSIKRGLSDMKSKKGKLVA